MTAHDKKRAAVLGWPVSHSLSPRLHNYWLKQYGLSGSYESIAVEPHTLESFLATLPAQHFSGVNLTIPYKEKALLLLDETDALAKRIGAVNTVIVKDGKRLGTNTDAYGFMANLAAHSKKLKPGNAVVLGAGGAARAICVGLLDAGWNVTLTNRTAEKAQGLKDFLHHEKVQTQPWELRAESLAGCTLLVNSTALGMKGQPILDIALGSLPRDAFVYDIVYSPLMTPLLDAARERGNPIITGLGMLLWQAQPAFEHFFGVRPEVTDALHVHMLEALS